MLAPRSVGQVTWSLKLVRVWPEFEYDFSTFGKFLRALCGKMSQWMSESVGESVSQSASRPRVDV